MAERESQVITTDDVGTVDASTLVAAPKAPRVTALRAMLEAERDALQAELAPYRATYEELINAPALREAKARIKEISAKLVPILNEIAGFHKAAGAKSLVVESGEYKS